MEAVDVTSTPPTYDASSIIVFPGLSAVRRNPSMYIGSTGPDGVRQLFLEVLDNAVDEYSAGFGRDITIHFGVDGSCSVTDEGRGIPIDRHPDTGVPACELVLTTLHSGGKFETGAYSTSAGLHGVGLSCVNALSASLRVDIHRDGVHATQSYARGEPLGPLETQPDASGRRGTTVVFVPDPEIFGSGGLSPEPVHQRMEELSFLHPGLRFTSTDERTGEFVEFVNEGGIGEYLSRRNDPSLVVHDRPLVISHGVAGTTLDVAVQWTENYAENILSFVNTVRTDQGGTHVDAVRIGLAAAIDEFARRHDLLEGMGPGSVTTTDILEGLTAVVALRTPSPRYASQTKTRLDTEELATPLSAAVHRAVDELFSADEALGRLVVGRALDATRARLAARMAGRTARRQQRALDIDYEVYRRQFGIRSKNWHSSCTWLTDEELLGAHAELSDVAPDARMLDVCCGSGVVGDSFRGKVGEMIGLDITPEMVELASERLGHVDQGTVYDLPYPDESFDLVVNREVLHLLPQPERPVSEIYRVLRPGGQFIVGQIIPYSDVDAFWMYRIFKKKQPLLFQMFTEAEFRRLLLEAGFTGLRMTEHYVWESIDRWIDTHETTSVHRQEIYRLFYDAPREVRAVHPFEVTADGSVNDRWRWCVYSLRKPATRV